VGIVEKWLVGRLSDQKGGISHMKFITAAQTRDECSFEKGGFTLLQNPKAELAML
jgi:hypothetical protein